MKKIVFLGCGKMGQAIMQNFLENNINRSDITIIDPSISNIKNPDDLDKNYQADIVILAIKPQNCQSIIDNFKNSNRYHQNTIFISILAGINCNFLEKILGNDKKIIRLMPNLPILLGEGISAYFANKNIKNNEEKDWVNLFGKNIKFTEEKFINKATAISGSGPAYLFLFAKNIIDAAQKIGLSKDDAQYLTKQTILGAAKMLQENNNIDELINNVTSKGGTTQAALEQFNNPDKSLQKLTQEAVKSAFKRAGELEKTP